MPLAAALGASAMKIDEKSEGKTAKTIDKRTCPTSIWPRSVKSAHSERGEGFWRLFSSLKFGDRANEIMSGCGRLGRCSSGGVGSTGGE